MDEAIGIFITEMAPYVIEEMESSSEPPQGAELIEQYDSETGGDLIRDFQRDETGYISPQRALDRINLSVNLCWPTFKKRLRNRRVMQSALQQILYANSFTLQEAQEMDDLEPLYVEQRLDDMTNILGRIGAEESQTRIEEMKISITTVPG